MDGIVVPCWRPSSVACVEALEDWLVDWLRAKGIDFVEVGYKDCARNWR